VISAVEGLVTELRLVGIQVSAADYMDALRGLGVADLSSRADVKAALGAALVKDHAHESAYSTVFDLYFSSLGDPSAPAGASAPAAASAPAGVAVTSPRGVLSGVDDQELSRLLLAALEAGQETLLRALAAELVSRHAGIAPGRRVAGTLYLDRVLGAAGADSMAARLLAEAGDAGGELDDLGRALLAEDYERRVTEFRRLVEAEIRRRMVADRGAADVARTLRTPLPEDAEFLTASAAQVAELRQAVVPLARKLATRLARRLRRQRRGALDFRGTARSAMSAGGVPMAPAFKRPRPSKPELVILADISGSVSAFAEFSLYLTYALRTEFTKVRSFVFADTADEVTGILASAADIAAATSQINARGCGVWLDGHSDYGNALESFARRHGGSLRKRTTVLVLGDARANYHATGALALRDVARRAGHVFWLNPEPAAAWNSGDSVIGEYAVFCDGVFECRNVRQLRAFIEQLVLLRQPGKQVRRWNCGN
jgi:uncharacterized protein with von Willebrand factor type A (vWA) domain